MNKKMGNDMEAGIKQGFVGIKCTALTNGNQNLRHVSRYTVIT